MSTQDRRFVAFGLRSLTTALRAKCGRLQKGEADKLVAFQGSIVPDDDAAREAALAFRSSADMDPFGAGAALLEWLDIWRDGLVCESAKEVEEKLSEQDPNWPKRDASQGEAEPPELELDEQENLPHFDWQDRADING